MSFEPYRERGCCNARLAITMVRTMLTLLVVLAITASLARADVLEYSDAFSGATLNPFWQQNVQIPGATITQGAGVLTIASPVAPSSHTDAQVVSNPPLPLGNFTASVDFLVPQGNAMAWLYASQSPMTNTNEHRFGVYLWDRSEYNVWYRNDEFSGWKYGRGAFGNENTAWHRLELSYNAPAKTISAYVDDIFLQSASVNLDNFVVTLKMKDSTAYGPGPSSVQFDNFRFSYQAVPEPSSMNLVVTCAGSMFGFVWWRVRKTQAR